MAELGDRRSISVSWSPPSPAPPMGYEVSVPTADINATTNKLIYTATFPVGVHTIQVRTISQHYMGEVASTTVSVTGERRHGIFDFEGVRNILVLTSKKL